MAGCNHIQTVLELRDLRAWRAFLIEARGVCRSLESLGFTRGMTLEDALAQLGFGGSAWARERWCELRAALDEPVADPLSGGAAAAAPKGAEKDVEKNAEKSAEKDVEKSAEKDAEKNADADAASDADAGLATAA